MSWFGWFGFVWQYYRPFLQGDPVKPFDGGLRIPVGRVAMVREYGDPNVTIDDDRHVTVSPAWERANMTLARDVAGIPSGRIYCHRKVEPYLREALRRVAATSSYRLTRIGCFNPRFQRHDPSLPLSDHTWGIAFDVDPDHNRARNVSRTIDPWTPQWAMLWPTGLPRSFVNAWESVGFEWGGRWRPFCDPMHFSLRRLR